MADTRGVPVVHITAGAATMRTDAQQLHDHAVSLTLTAADLNAQAARLLELADTLEGRT